MRHVRPADVPKAEVVGPLFVGDVNRQDIVGADNSQDFNLSIVNFQHGAKNKFHRHSNDQILIVTSGIGVVATEAEEVVVNEGDIIHVVGGEKHWHGAKEGEDFSHITITKAGSTTEILE